LDQVLIEKYCFKYAVEFMSQLWRDLKLSVELIMTNLVVFLV